MSWLKDVIVDIIATIIIVTAVFIDHNILTVVVWGYTGLLLISKLLVYFAGDFFNMIDKAKSAAPEWFNHLLYAINTCALFSFSWWYAGAGWVLIWLLSFLTQQKINKQST